MSQQRLHVATASRHERILTVLLVSLVLALATTAAAPASADDLSASQVSTVRAIATLRPCAATVLLYTLHMPANERQGDLYLQRPLSEQDVNEQLEELNENASVDTAELAALQWNPYASVPFLTRVHWLRVSLGHDAFILTTSAELVDQTGAYIQPIHTVEPVTTVLLSQGHIQLLDKSSSM